MTKIPAVLVSALVLLGLASSPAWAGGRPRHLTGGQHSCSYTNPEYMLSDYDMSVRPKPGSTAFTATWMHSSKPWEDAYWVSGWHDENSRLCNKRELPGSHGKYGRSFNLPIRVASRLLVTADLKIHGAGRLGFDLWLTANPSEHGPAQMQRDRRTWEILLGPGHGAVRRDNPGWHRIFEDVLPERNGTVSLRGFNLTRVVRLAQVPVRDYWMAVDAGAETTHGSFSVYNYQLHIADQHPQPRRYYRVTVSARVSKRATAAANREATGWAKAVYRGVTATATATARASVHFTSRAWSRTAASATARTRSQAYAEARNLAVSKATRTAESFAKKWAVKGAHVTAKQRAKRIAQNKARQIARFRAELLWRQTHTGKH